MVTERACRGGSELFFSKEAHFTRLVFRLFLFFHIVQPSRFAAPSEAASAHFILRLLESKRSATMELEANEAIAFLNVSRCRRDFQ